MMGRPYIMMLEDISHNRKSGYFCIKEVSESKNNLVEHVVTTYSKIFLTECYLHKKHPTKEDAA